jgi:SagB-type dehydrogenase family enzyme
MDPLHALTLQREFLKDHIRQAVDFSLTEQARGLPPPPLQKPVPTGAYLIDLPKSTALTCAQSTSLYEAINNRRSRRKFTDQPLSLEELAWLLWATQGIQRVFRGGSAFRTVPSAGARHAFETYLALTRVEGIPPALYRYLPVDHQLVREREVPDLGSRCAEAALDQHFVADAAVTFIWTALPRRMEWRYGLAAHKVILLDAGHVGQNLYLACEAIHAGTCTLAAYDQDQMDSLIGVDGAEEFAVYMAPVGKVK